MTDKLKRVMWRLRSHRGKMNKPALENAIRRECGVWPETIKINIDALKKLGWIRMRGWSVRITGKDEEES